MTADTATTAERLAKAIEIRDKANAAAKLANARHAQAKAEVRALEKELENEQLQVEAEEQRAEIEALRQMSAAKVAEVERLRIELDKTHTPQPIVPIQPPTTNGKTWESQPSLKPADAPPIRLSASG